ncbi:MAG TPA: toxin-antitoxin system HicB family antitoxin [Acidimicrobiales bacterium]|nr:toxin-antitoxin system HicB family antitoxin [Acidimicrobiales bacterium]
MKMSSAVEGWQSDVLAVGELGDELVAEVAERIASVLARSASSRLLDLLGEVVAEVSEELPEGRVELRLVGDEIEFAYMDERAAAPEDEGELSSRITLRLSDRLKTRVEESAARDGVSVNGWILRALERGTSHQVGRSGRAGSRLHGFGTS